MKLTRTKSLLLRTASVFTICLPTLFIQATQAETPTSPPGTYSTSWIGNTYMEKLSNGTNKNVTELLGDVCVSPQGHVFTAGYAETGGGGATYSAADGSFIGRYSGTDSGFGDPLAVVAANDNYVYYGTGSKGLLRAAHGGTSGIYTRFLSGKNIQGLYIKNGKLYISDFGDGKIRIWNISNMTEESSFLCANPTRITVDNSGNIWVVISSAASIQPPSDGPMWWGEKIKSFSATGTPGPEITDFEKPLSVAFNNSGQLLVGGLNENSQIWIYDVTGTPAKVGTFGTEKGIFGGTVAGAFTNTAKLHWIHSIAVDADNNIYTGCTYGTFWGGVVEKWNNAGTLQWRNFAGTSLDCAGIDPENETEVYSKFHHYSLDYSKTTPGTEWSLKGFTVDRFKYPNDNRVDQNTDVQVRSLGAGAYRIGGKLFMARSRQYGYAWELYRQETSTNGEVLVPSVIMASGGGESMNKFYNSTTKTWYEKPKKDNLYNQWWSIAKNGDIFTIADNPDKIIQYKFGGLDENSNPKWDAENATITPSPMDYDARRVYYDSDNDVMYIAGDEPEGQWDTFQKIRRFDDWSKGNRTASFTAILPIDDTSYTPDNNYGGGMPNSFSVAGDYMFVLYGYGHVRIISKLDGSLVGTLTQNVNGYHGAGGQVDAPYGMTSYKRLSGEYIILFENAGWANIMMYRWCPGDCSACDKVPVTNFGITQETESLIGKEQKSLTTEILPETACRTIVWRSSNPSVASVVDGKITGISVGTTTISASIDNGAFSDSCKVSVNDIPVESVALSKDTIKLMQFKKEFISVAVSPESALNKVVEFKTLDTNIATVDPSGLVTAIAPGQTFLIAKSVDGDKTDTCVVIVSEVKRLPFFGTPMNIPGKIEAENFDIGGEGLAYHDTDPTNNSHQYRLDEGVDIDPCGDTGGGYNIGWINANEWLLYFVNIESGIYDVSVRVAALDTKSQCSLLLNDTLLGAFDIPVTGDWQKYTTISKLDMPLIQGEYQTLKVLMNTGGFNLNYMIFQKSVPVESFSLEKDTLELKIKGTYTFNTTILPENTSRSGVNWSSGNASIFTVDLWGNVTAKSVLGEAYLYAKSIDGIHQDSCLIKVVQNLTGINDDLASKIQVYPNPTNKSGFTISGMPNGNAIIKITTLNGQSVFNQKVYTSGSLHIADPKISKGIYILTLDCQGKIANKKLIVN